MILCSEAEIGEEQAKGFTINPDLQIFVVRKDGLISVFENRCPHLGIPLEMMPNQFLDRDKSFIQCSTHGALFQIDNGFCVAGPCSGASLRQFTFVLRDGNIHIQIDE
jgi:nitrite reductase/ring-hydroxylating ferredoxin subunit